MRNSRNAATISPAAAAAMMTAIFFTRLIGRPPA
jgi:hypothetical protein